MKSLLKKFFACQAAFLFFASASVGAESWEELVQDVMPTTVNIQVVKEETAVVGSVPRGWEDFFDFYGQQMQPREVNSLGSGFFIDREGHIVTNYHVVSGAKEIKVQNHKGDEMEAIVVGSHEDSDLAVIKISDPSGFDFEVSKWGDSDKAMIGSPVIAIGNPYGLSGTVTTGIVSARGRDMGIGRYDNFIQTDATIDQGNSGGPLLNNNGEVIGINSMMVIARDGQKIGLAFAIPSNWARTIVDQILTYGEPRMGAIGVNIESVTPQLRKTLGLPEKGGALVTSVMEGSPAEEAGALRGDVVVAFGDSEISDSRDLIRAVAQVPVNTVVNMKVWRQVASRMGNVRGEYVDLRVKVGLRNSVLGTGSLVPAMGAKISSVASLSPQAVENYGLQGETEGVVITRVTPGSPAALAGLAAGDLILVVSGYDVTTIEEVERIFADLEGDWTVLVWYKRQGSVQYAIVESSTGN